MAGTNTGAGDFEPVGKRLEEGVEFRLNGERSRVSTHNYSSPRDDAGAPHAQSSPNSPTHLGFARSVITRARVRSELTAHEAAQKGLAGLWRGQGGPPVPNLAQPKQYSLPDIQGLDDDDDEEQGHDDDDDMKIESDEQTEPIVPNYEGFKAHVRRLNPNMDPRHNWLVSRIAHQQEIRYKALLDLRVKHCQAVLQHNCGAGSQCVTLGGTSILLDSKGKPRSQKLPEFTGLQLVTDFSDTDSNPGEGALTDETFPTGIPMPPVRNLPAEFECQLCFKAKKCLKPSDWTKHVHEDVQLFTCTWDKCKEPKSFKKKTDWVRHENERHRHLEWWICQVDDCRHSCYRKDNFLQHLVREHKFPEPKQRTKAAIKKFKDTEPAWIMLEQCHHETMNRPQDEPCKFCGKTLNTWKKLTVHLANHMRHITLPILRLVEVRNVDANTIIEPVEHTRSPVLPISVLESPSPFNLNGMPPYIPMAKSFSSGFGQAAYNPTIPVTQNFSSGFEEPTSYHKPSIIIDEPARSFYQTAGTSAAYGMRIPRSPPSNNFRASAPSLSQPGDVLPRFHPRKGDQDWDLRSLASLDSYRDSALGSSLPSDISLSVGQGLPRTAQEEVLIILNSDSGLRSLFEEAARRIGRPRFVRNIRRLFLMYHKDLQEHAVDPREKDATSIIEKHAEWLASRLFDICNPNGGSNSQAMAAHLNQQIDKRTLLERYLASITRQSKDPSSTSLGGSLRRDSRETPGGVKQQQDVSTDSEQGDYSEEGDEEETQDINTIDYSNFPNLEHIKNFMIGGAAFRNLCENTTRFVYPEEQPQPQPGLGTLQENAQGPDHMSTSSLTENTSSMSQGPGNLVSQDSTSSTAATDITIPYADNDTDSDTSELSSDPELCDEPPENRILNPKAYFERLRSLEREILHDSGILAFKNGISTSAANDNCLLQGSANRFVFSASVDTEVAIRLIKLTRSEKLLSLLESYNLVTRIGRSLTKLQDNGYCTGHISLLVKDQDRVEVAKLVQVESQAILGLGSAFEGVLSTVISTLSTMQILRIDHEMANSVIDGHDSQRGLTIQCMEMLNRMGLSPHLLLNDVHPTVWECVTQSLELGILSYAGAHLQRFDLELLAKDIDSFQIPRRVIYHDQVLKDISSRPGQHSIILRRRKLQCLDGFLGGIQPWVFHQDFANNGDHRLCLSTSMNGLTDLWGPSWRIIRDSEPGCIQQLDIGNGAIVPWPANANPPEKKMEMRSFEVFCHWISFKDWHMQDIDLQQLPLSRKFFLESDTLLIGASPDFGLVVNQDCTTSMERLIGLKTKLDQEGALRSPKTSRPQRYIDSHAVQVQGTAMGILSAAGIVTYKRRSGQTMKDALIERWSHSLYNPMDLEAYSGIEISLCTRNARRRRLLHLLGSATMHNYLCGINFKWISEDCKYSYFKALRSPKHFRKFWKCNLEYRENLGDAISKCLEALEETGIDEDSRELRGLWIESFDTEGDSDGESDGGVDSGDEKQASPPPHSTAVAKEPSKFFEEWIVTLFRSEHTWTGFLEDSEESLTMAILDMACLDFDHGGYGRRCSQPQPAASSSKGYPVLQTSLQVNDTILNGAKLKCEVVDSGRTKIWNAKELKRGTPFSLGDHGALKVLIPASRTCPVIMEWSGVKSETFHEVKNVAIKEKLLGKNKDKHHREFIRGKWEAKPLPILVLSKSTKVKFSKG